MAGVGFALGTIFWCLHALQEAAIPACVCVCVCVCVCCVCVCVCVCVCCVCVWGGGGGGVSDHLN